MQLHITTITSVAYTAHCRRA